MIIFIHWNFIIFIIKHELKSLEKMKFVIILLLTALVANIGHAEVPVGQELEIEWHLFMKEHGKTYSSENEELIRY